MIRHVILCGYLCIIVLISACTSAPSKQDAQQSLSDRLLGKIGLERASSASTDKKQKPPYTIDIALAAGENLNAGNSNRPASVVIKIYQLKNDVAIGRLTLSGAQSPDIEKQQLGDDLIASREVVLIPGQHLSINESVSAEASAVSIVALFHSPAEQRWKFSFSPASAQTSGITIGVHACAMTVSRGTPLREDAWQDDAKLARTRCLAQ